MSPHRRLETKTHGINLLLLLLVVFVLVFAATHPIILLGAQSGAPPQQLLLTPTSEIDQDPYFDWILAQSHRGAPIETAKIEYLIERIRKSPYQFIRNRAEYSAAEAARHLAWKYEHGRKYIETAHDFIQLLATRSLESGLLYFVKLPNGATYPVRDLLENELFALERSLIKKRATHP